MSEVVADGIASINYYAKDRSEAVSPPIAYIGKLYGRYVVRDTGS